jgi:DNA-binding protein HU-beta
LTLSVGLPTLSATVAQCRDRPVDRHAEVVLRVCSAQEIHTFFHTEERHMNKSELAQALANRADLSKADATRAVEAIFNPEDGLITQALRQGDRVQITGFGTFETRERKARTGRNPRTGHEIRIGPTTSASFRPGKALKDAVKPDQ